MYSSFLIRTTFKSRDSFYLRVTLSQPPRTFCSRGRKYLNTNIVWDLWRLLVWVELLIRITICQRKLVHCTLPFLFPSMDPPFGGRSLQGRAEAQGGIWVQVPASARLIQPPPFNSWAESFSLIYCRRFWSEEVSCCTSGTCAGCR